MIQLCLLFAPATFNNISKFINLLSALPPGDTTIGTSGVEAQAGMDRGRGCFAGGHLQLEHADPHCHAYYHDDADAHSHALSYAHLFDPHCYSHFQNNDDEKERRRLLAGPQS